MTVRVSLLTRKQSSPSQESVALLTCHPKSWHNETLYLALTTTPHKSKCEDNLTPFGTEWRHPNVGNEVKERSRDPQWKLSLSRHRPSSFWSCRNELTPHLCKNSRIALGFESVWVLQNVTVGALFSKCAGFGWFSFSIFRNDKIHSFWGAKGTDNGIPAVVLVAFFHTASCLPQNILMSCALS